MASLTGKVAIVTGSSRGIGRAIAQKLAADGASVVVNYTRVIALNVRGTFFALQEAARRLEDGGRIVNISSVATLQSFAGKSVYAASKAAVEQFTRVLAKELEERGITVNSVSPVEQILAMWVWMVREG